MEAGEGAVGVDFEDVGCLAGRVAGVFPACCAEEVGAVCFACSLVFLDRASGVSSACLLFFFFGKGLSELSDESEEWESCIIVGALEWAGVNLFFNSFENLDFDLFKCSPRPSSVAANLKFAR